MLGDLFEVWVGDDARTLPFERRCVDVLAEAASRRSLAFMVGNRDFLLGAGAAARLRHDGPARPHGAGRLGPARRCSPTATRCAWPTPTTRPSAREVRIGRLAAGASWPGRWHERLAVAAAMRTQSAARRRFDGDAGVDVDAADAVRWLHAMGAAEMVHGHTHRPGSSVLAPGFKRHVLSDWDLDAGQPRRGAAPDPGRLRTRLPPAGR